MDIIEPTEDVTASCFTDGAVSQINGLNKVDKTPGFLRATDDAILLILQYIIKPPFRRQLPSLPDLSTYLATLVQYKFDEAKTTTTAMTKPHTPIADLKNLALVHSHFLDPIRSLLYRNPLIFSSTALRHPSLHGPMESIAARQKGERSIQILQSALLSNPTLGSFVRSLILLEEVAPHFPTAIVALLRLTPALRELCMPFVETKYQEDVMASVCRMKDLRVIRFACAGWNESDLRRIATSCSNLEELILVGDGVRFCEGTVVEPYAFHNLLSLKVVIATYTTFYLTDAHLLALVSHSRRLQRFVVKGNFGHAVDSPFAHHLTLQGVAAVMERRGKSLREICVHSSFREHNTLNIESMPAIESALIYCTNLRHLALIGPYLVSPYRLHRLGCPPISTFPLPTASQSSSTIVYSSLNYLESLTLGLHPFQYPPLLRLISSLRPPSNGQRSPYHTLKRMNIILGHVDSLNDRLAAEIKLKELFKAMTQVESGIRFDLFEDDTHRCMWSSDAEKSEEAEEEKGAEVMQRSCPSLMTEGEEEEDEDDEDNTGIWMWRNRRPWERRWRVLNSSTELLLGPGEYQPRRWYYIEDPQLQVPLDQDGDKMNRRTSISQEKDRGEEIQEEEEEDSRILQNSDEESYFVYDDDVE